MISTEDKCQTKPQQTLPAGETEPTHPPACSKEQKSESSTQQKPKSSGMFNFATGQHTLLRNMINGSPAPTHRHIHFPGYRAIDTSKDRGSPREAAARYLRHPDVSNFSDWINATRKPISFLRTGERLRLFNFSDARAGSGTPNQTGFYMKPGTPTFRSAAQSELRPNVSQYTVPQASCDGKALGQRIDFADEFERPLSTTHSFDKLIGAFIRGWRKLRCQTFQTSGENIQALGDADAVEKLIPPNSTARRINSQPCVDIPQSADLQLDETRSHREFRMSGKHVAERSSYWTVPKKCDLAFPPNADVALVGVTVHSATNLRLIGKETPGLILEPEVLFGLVQVTNRAYEKVVTVRTSTNGWKSYNDYAAIYVPPGSNKKSLSSDAQTRDKYDTFAFSVPLPKNSDVCEFAIEYRWGTGDTGGVAWDNNGGRNYRVQRGKQPADTESTFDQITISEGNS
ncbi:unnamed protein product [Calicophoron daubneyi]|uniref:CBM21 domain-containing protein n=1 Tax=Calicophoron daubneyi TaxID=300641 RepID=A0AAV2TL52_CALDB